MAPVLILAGLSSVIAFGVIACLFAVIYKALPDAPLSWRDIWIGTEFTRQYALGFGSLREEHDGSSPAART